MNSKTTFLLFTVILAVVLCRRIDAFTAGAGNIKKRDYNQVKLYSNLRNFLTNVTRNYISNSNTT